MTDYFKIEFNEDRDVLLAYQKSTPNGKAYTLAPSQMQPIGTPKRVLARGQDLFEVIEKLFPEVKEGERVANAFMVVHGDYSSLEKLIQFYLC